MLSDAVQDWSIKRIGGNGRADKMLAFADYLYEKLVIAGVPPEDIFYRGNKSKGRATTLPGYYRASKAWDFVVCRPPTQKNERHQVVSVVEFKSQRGAIGKNQQNRLEEALGNVVDLRAAHEHGLIGNSAEPLWIGYLLLCSPGEDELRNTVKIKPNFLPLDDVYTKINTENHTGLDYIGRYEVALERMVKATLYDNICFIKTNDQIGLAEGKTYTCPAENLNDKSFVESLLRSTIKAYR